MSLGQSLPGEKFVWVGGGGGGGGGVESKFSVQLWSKPKLCPWT